MPTQYPLRRGAAGEIAQRVSTAATIADVDVSNTSTQIVAANTSRRTLLLVNDSATKCWINLGGTATTDDIPLAASGGSLFLDRVVFTGVVNGITSSGTADVRVMEL